MRSVEKILRSRYISLKRLLRFAHNKKEVIRFKKEIWQTNEVSASFIKNTDGASVVAADLMDKEVNEYFLAECNKGDKVLDIGCGHGIVSVFLAEHGIHVTAVDISDKLLAELRSRISGRDIPVDIRQGDAYNIPCAENYFDVVVARMFLPHFPDWPVVLKEMARVTKKGGKIVVHFSSKENTQIGKQLKQAECRFASSPDVSDPWSFYAETDNAELKQVAATINLELVKRSPVSFFLHNRIIGYQLGTEEFNKYMERAQEYFKEEKVKEFVLWFDKEIISRCAPALSHFNIITFKKL